MNEDPRNKFEVTSSYYKFVTNLSILLSINSSLPNPSNLKSIIFKIANILVQSISRRWVRVGTILPTRYHRGHRYLPKYLEPLHLVLFKSFITSLYFVLIFFFLFVCVFKHRVFRGFSFERVKGLKFHWRYQELINQVRSIVK